MSLLASSLGHITSDGFDIDSVEKPVVGFGV